MHQDGPSVSAKTCGRAVAYFQDVLTLTPHTTDNKTLTDTTLESPAGSAHRDADVLRQGGGQQLAYSSIGAGRPLLYVSGWLSHLELSWELSEERAFYERLAEGCRLVRYDRAGCGLPPYQATDAPTSPTPSTAKSWFTTRLATTGTRCSRMFDPAVTPLEMEVISGPTRSSVAGPRCWTGSGASREASRARSLQTRL